MTVDPIPELAADAVRAFFAKHEAASLQLPRGWFGRPHDSRHHLTEVTSDSGGVRIRLDEVQVLDLVPTRITVEGRILRLSIESGLWAWTEYGGTQSHNEALAAGDVLFHAPLS